MLVITIPGEPSVTAQQKGFNLKAHLRGRAAGKANRGWFTKDKVKIEASRYRAHIRQQKPDGPPLDGPLMCRLTFYFPLTQKLAAIHVNQLSNLDFELPYFAARRNDADNLSKLLFDVLTETAVWRDDGLVCDLVVRKRYGTFPRIVVEIQPFAYRDDNSAASGEQPDKAT